MTFKESLIIAEYNALKVEIQNKIKLLDRIDMSGVVGLPATFVVANYTELKAFFFFIPLIILTITINRSPCIL